MTTTNTATSNASSVAAAQVPDLESLTDGIASVLRVDPCDVAVLHRRPNIQTSTFPSEVITCRLSDGGELKLFTKYADRSVNHIYGHRSGVAFEAMVYRDVLEPLKSPRAVRHYGQYAGRDGGETWLFLKALDEIARVNKSPDGRAMIDSAKWAGQFHAANESRVREFADRVHRYDSAYLSGWARRTSELADGTLHTAFPWLAGLCRRCETFLPEALSRRLTLIHGEYYPKNILMSDGIVYPVDWESVAAAPGEVDFASLTENWPAETIAKCRQAYIDARWMSTGRAVPDDFDATVEAAGVYLHFRWLGNRREWTNSEKFHWRFLMLLEAGKRLGLIDDTSSVSPSSSL